MIFFRCRFLGALILQRSAMLPALLFAAACRSSAGEIGLMRAFSAATLQLADSAFALLGKSAAVAAVELDTSAEGLRISSTSHCTDDFYVSVCQPSTYSDLGIQIHIYTYYCDED